MVRIRIEDAVSPEALTSETIDRLLLSPATAVEALPRYVASEEDVVQIRAGRPFSTALAGGCNLEAPKTERRSRSCPRKRNCCAWPVSTSENHGCSLDAYSLIEDAGLASAAGGNHLLQRAGLEETRAELVRSFLERGSRLEDRLQRRIVSTVIPQIAQGFLDDGQGRPGIVGQPTDEELAEMFRASLIFLYRLLFLLYAESRAFPTATRVPSPSP